MQNNVKLKKLGFRAALPKARQFFNMFSADRERLSPWFWWMSKAVTPNLPKSTMFMLLYILDTKRKKLAHTFNPLKTYDEQFLIMVNGKIGGLTGLDNIDITKKDAEIWYLVTNENEGHGIASQAINLVQRYSAFDKKLNSLYAKVASGNEKSSALLKRNDYEIEKVEYGVPTSKRNPKITDLTTWRKGIWR